MTRLTTDEQQQLIEWLDCQKKRLRHERPTVQQAARQAADALGFHVTEHNLRTARTAAGVTWTAARKRWSEIVPRIAREVVDLKRLLDLPVPEDLDELAN